MKGVQIKSGWLEIVLSDKSQESLDEKNQYSIETLYSLHEDVLSPAIPHDFVTMQTKRKAA